MLKNQFPCLNNSFIANYNFDVSMKSLNGDVYQYRWEGEGKKNNVNITSCCLKTTQYHCVTGASVDLQKVLDQIPILFVQNQSNLTSIEWSSLNVTQNKQVD